MSNEDERNDSTADQSPGQEDQQGQPGQGQPQQGQPGQGQPQQGQPGQGQPQQGQPGQGQPQQGQPGQGQPGRGGNINQPGGAAQQAGSTDTSPIVAGLLSFIIPGVGHIVAGEPVKGRGIYWLAGTAVAFVGLSIFTLITLGIGGLLFFGWPLIHIAAGVDAYVQVDNIYQGPSQI